MPGALTARGTTAPAVFARNSYTLVRPLFSWRRVS